MRKNIVKQTALGLCIAVVISILISFLVLIGVFRGLELKTLDYRFQWRGPQDVSHSDLIIITIDDQTFKSCRDRYHFPRDYYATLVENLNEVGVKLIMFDIQFTEPDFKNPLGDRILADAIGKSGNVILAGKIARIFTRGGLYEYVDEPIPVLMETGSDWGVVGEMQDSDGFMRRYLIFEPYQDRILYSLGSKVFFFEKGLPRSPKWSFDGRDGYFVFSDSSGGNVQKILGHRGSGGFEQTILINYYGPASTFPTYSLSSVLDDADFDLRDEEDTDYLEIFKKNSIYPYEFKVALLADSAKQVEAFTALALGDTERVDEIIDSENPFKDKIALIGVSLEELHDNKYTPFYNYGGVQRLMPGVETHAHAIQTMIDGSFIKVVPILVNILIIFILSMITAV
ncbi:MAG: CHASE2 domain-containing protein, partial [Bacteroidales bacterium]|nr:CHASE2 domain-containing protein [Bacteroidales bacterium]